MSAAQLMLALIERVEREAVERYVSTKETPVVRVETVPETLADQLVESGRREVRLQISAALDRYDFEHGRVDRLIADVRENIGAQP